MIFIFKSTATVYEQKCNKIWLANTNVLFLQQYFLTAGIVALPILT